MCSTPYSNLNIPLQERCVSAYIDRNDYLSRYESSPSATINKSELNAQKANLDKQKQQKLLEDMQQQQQKEDIKINDLQSQKELVRPRQRSEGRQANNVGLIIGNVLSDLDPVSKNKPGSVSITNNFFFSIILTVSKRKKNLFDFVNSRILWTRWNERKKKLC